MTDIMADIVVKPIEIVNGRKYRLIRNMNAPVACLGGSELGGDGDILISIKGKRRVLRRQVKLVSDDTDWSVHFEDITDEGREG